MFDVSNYAPLSSPFTINPFFQTSITCINKAAAEFSMPRLKGNKNKVNEIVFETDYFQEEYAGIEEEKLESFKRSLKRTFHCGVTHCSLVTPLHGTHNHFMCKNKGCIACAAWKAIQYLHYPNHIVRYVTFKDSNHGTSLLRDIQNFIKICEFNWLAIVLTPFHDGGGMIRLSNMRESEMNPLTDDNKVKKSINTFDEIYPFFDTAKDITAQGSIEQVYISESGVRFTTTELYQVKPEGRNGSREGGTKPGFEFDAELGEVIFMSIKDRKKKQAEEDEALGIVARENMPAVNLKGLRHEVAHKALMSAMINNSAHPDYPLYSTTGVTDMRHLTVNIMNDFIDELEQAGHPQPGTFNLVKITEKQVVEFNKEIGIPPMSVPDNIDELNFSEDDLGLVGPVYGIIGNLQARKNRQWVEVQNRIKNMITFDELVNKTLKEMSIVPPE